MLHNYAASTITSIVHEGNSAFSLNSDAPSFSRDNFLATILVIAVLVTEICCTILASIILVTLLDFCNKYGCKYSREFTT